MPSDQWKAEVEYVLSAGSMAEAKRRLAEMDTDPLDAIVAEAIDGLRDEAPDLIPNWNDWDRVLIQNAIRAAIRADRQQRAAEIEAMRLVGNELARAFIEYGEEMPAAIVRQFMASGPNDGVIERQRDQRTTALLAWAALAAAPTRPEE